MPFIKGMPFNVERSFEGDAVNFLFSASVVIESVVGDFLLVKDIASEVKFAFSKDARSKLALIPDSSVDAATKRAIIEYLDDVEGAGKWFKDITVESADDVNLWWKAKGYEHLPYKPGTQVTTIEITQETKFVRVYDNINSKQAGGWVMRAEDIAGLTPQQIQNKFALPSIPTHVTDVIFNPGDQLRTGIANGLFGFDGGGIQFDLMNQWIGNFTNGRLLP